MGGSVSNLEKYVQMAQELQMADAKLISTDDIVFDVRAILKCRWGCEDYFRQSIKCHPRGTTLQERREMLKAYQKILLVHGHDARQMSKAVLEIERTAFLDGHYFAFAVQCCNLCKHCAVDQGKACPNPEKVRPCDQSFGIDVYGTARNLGLPCNVLQDKTETPNRYGFVLIQ
jgi:predicted metal-binding protein